MKAPFEDLRVWREAHTLALAVYRETRNFPREERYGLSAQLRRSAVSVPANLAEGNARGSIPENIRFCKIAKGSLAETRYFLRIARDLGYLEDSLYSGYDDEYDQVGKMIHYLIEALAKRGTWA